tara:strand:- start:344 stop:1036 length:693 start_codon:yes stop_codon:yes gene_type:complete
MASILKVNTIQDATNSNTVATFDSSGVASIPKQAGIYEHIMSKVSTSNGQLAPSAGIRFNNVFSSDYITYKVVIGYLNFTGGSGDDLTFRFLTGTDTDISSSDYQYTLTNQRHNNDSYLAISGNNQAQAIIFKDLWNNEAGGVHGELNIYNVVAPVIDGANTDKGTYYRPMVINDLVGYADGINHYTRQSGMVRYNPNNQDTHYTGFTLQFGQEERSTTHIQVYGLRVHA